MRLPIRLAAILCVVVTLASSTRGADVDVNALLARVGDRVRDYFQHAQKIVATETVQIQPLNMELLPPSSIHRHLVYELHVSWDAAEPGQDTEATVVRTLVKADGKPPKPNDQPRCLDLPQISPEPLMMLLPEHRSEYVFTYNGTGKTDGRRATIVDFRSAKSSPVEVKWTDDCVSWSSERIKGRVWLDPETDDVLRLDHYLPGMVELPAPPDRERRGHASLTVERNDSSIRYKPIAFHDPDETLMLPDSIEILSVSRGSASSTVRTFQKFSDYKRFLGESHLVDP